jgi:hypothetical protein
MSKISILQTKTSKDFSGLVLKDSLQALGYSADFNVDALTQVLYRSKFKLGTADYLDMIGNVRVVDQNHDGWIKWKLQGSALKTVPLVRAETEAGATIAPGDQAGLSKTTFYLVFGEKYFSNEHLIAGERGSDYQLKVIGEPEDLGNEFRYPVRLWGSDLTLFMPGELLISGKQFSVDGAPVESTLAKNGADFNFTSPFEMKNTYTKCRFKTLAPNNMIGRALSWKLAVDGNEFTVWDDYLRYEMMLQMKTYKDRMLYYGRLNSDDAGRVLDKGSSGFTARTGAGIQQQIESGGNFVPQAKPNIKELIELIMDLSDNDMGFEEEYNILIETGQYGAQFAFNWITEQAKGFTILQSDNSDKPGAYKGRKFDPTFTQIKAPNGAILTFKVKSIFDDKSDARTSIPMSVVDPSLPGPASSYTYQITNLGTKDGTSNLELIYVNQKEDYVSVKPGVGSPYVPMMKGLGGMAGLATIPDEGTEYHIVTPEFAAILKDPTRSAIIKPSVLVS